MKVNFHTCLDCCKPFLTDLTHDLPTRPVVGDIFEFPNPKKPKFSIELEVTTVKFVFGKSRFIDICELNVELHIPKYLQMNIIEFTRWVEGT